MIRIGILAHYHPSLMGGGGQQAAYNLFSQLKKLPFIKPIFIARCEVFDVDHFATPFCMFDDKGDEILWATPKIDEFRLHSLDYEALNRQTQELFSYLHLDLLHLGHYTTGVDLIDIIDERFNIPIIVTLHEFLGICANGGHMVKTNGDLCYEDLPNDCANCIKEFLGGHFLLRKQFILQRFKKVTHFISPSEFLKTRYTRWGISENDISFIENLLSSYTETGQTLFTQKGSKIKFGVFGNIAKVKGTQILLEAISLLPESIRKKIDVLIFGNEITIHNPDEKEFYRQIKSLIEYHSDVVRLYGPYRNETVIHLMKQVDWVVVPSIWWENAPLVIQEAQIAGTPVLCSDIGGMVEKVKKDVNGIHFTVGSKADLADKIAKIVTEDLAVQPQPMEVLKTNKERLAQHLSVYDKILNTDLAQQALRE